MPTLQRQQTLTSNRQNDCSILREPQCDTVPTLLSPCPPDRRAHRGGRMEKVGLVRWSLAKLAVILRWVRHVSLRCCHGRAFRRSVATHTYPSCPKGLEGGMADCGWQTDRFPTPWVCDSAIHVRPACDAGNLANLRLLCMGSARDHVLSGKL